MSNEPKMTAPIDYLAFVEWPCVFGATAWTCVDPACHAYCGRHGNIAEANHDKECRIAQRNAALQAAHAMQQDLATNAAMLARQCDLAREAELQLAVSRRDAHAMQARGQKIRERCDAEYGEFLPTKHQTLAGDVLAIIEAGEGGVDD